MLRGVSTKQIVQGLLEQMPEDATLHEVAERIEFVAAIREGVESLERGEGIPIEELEREMATWDTE